MAEEKKLTYRVRDGVVHGGAGQYQAGDEVELTEAEAKGFLDKLVLVTAPKKTITPEQAAAIPGFLPPVDSTDPVPPADAPEGGNEPDEDATAMKPEDVWALPAFQALKAAGYDTEAKIRAATDDELLGVKGIGTGKLAQVRRYTLEG